MARQLAIVPGVADLEIDTTRTVLRVAAEPIRRAPESAIQFDLVPIRRRANKDVDEATRMRQLAEDSFEYLAEHPEMRGEIRSRRKKVSVPRLGREGDRPESLGNVPLTDEEVNEMRQDEAFLAALGVNLGPPGTWGKCAKKGPCGRVSCRHHNYLEVDETTGAIKLNFPGVGPEELEKPCSLREAERLQAQRTKPRGPRGEVATHEEVSARVGLAAERTRQIESAALTKLKYSRQGRRLR